MDVLLTILGMFAVTYLSRVLPMIRDFRGDNRFVKFIPPSIFAALVFPEMTDTSKALAGLIVLAVATKNRSLLVAMVVGVASLYVIEALI